MRIGLFTDIHVTPDPERGKRIIDTLEYMKKTFIREGVSDVINLGDFFDLTKITSYTEVLVLNSYVSLFSGFHNHVLIGNHEILRTDDMSSSIWKAIKLIPSFSVFDGPGSLSINDGEFNCYFLPYGVKPDFKSPVDILFHHQDVFGMFYPSGKVMDGDESIRLEDIPAKMVIGGHIHIKQTYKNSVYLGSVIHKSYDYIENFTVDKLPSFYIFDTKDLSLSQIRNPYSNINLKYTDNSDVQGILHDLNSIYQINPEYNVNIRFLYSGGDYDFSSVESKINKMFPLTRVNFFRKVVPISDRTVENSKEGDEVNSKISNNLDESIRSYLKQKDPELIRIYERVK